MLLEREAQWEAMSSQLAGQQHGRSRGLVGCRLAPRPGSYDHKRHHKLATEGVDTKAVRLPVWDFLLQREDGTGMRLHPQRSTTAIETFEDAGHRNPIDIPRRGHGTSDGRGTYRRYVALQTLESLRFDHRIGAGPWPPK